MSGTVTYQARDNPLEHVRNIPLPAHYGRFSPSSEFKEGNMIGGVRVGKVGEEFMRLFLPIPFAKRSRDIPFVPPFVWPCWSLVRPVYDTDIFHVWLGDENKVSDLVRVFQVMSLGAKGPLALNGLANCAFVRPVLVNMKAPRTVYWSIHLGEWHIHAIMEPVDDLREVRRRCRMPRGVHMFGGDAPDVAINQP